MNSHTPFFLGSPADVDYGIRDWAVSCHPLIVLASCQAFQNRRCVTLHFIINIIDKDAIRPQTSILFDCRQKTTDKSIRTSWNSFMPVLYSYSLLIIYDIPPVYLLKLLFTVIFINFKRICIENFFWSDLIAWLLGLHWLKLFHEFIMLSVLF